LQTLLDFCLLLRGDLFAQGFGLPFHGLRRHRQPSQQLQLFPPLLKGGLAAHHRHHPPHPGRIFRALRRLPSPGFRSRSCATRLIDIAQHHDLSSKVVLLARSFNLNQWTEALQDGAFDVLDVVCDVPKAAEAAKRAFGAAYPRRFRSRA